MSIVLQKSDNPKKKFMVTLGDSKIYFGASGYSDYTQHKDPIRKRRYILRHRVNEIWTKSGISTPGFWSRWLLWNKKSLPESINHIQKKFGIKIVPKL